MVKWETTKQHNIMHTVQSIVYVERIHDLFPIPESYAPPLSHPLHHPPFRTLHSRVVEPPQVCLAYQNMTILKNCVLSSRFLMFFKQIEIEERSATQKGAVLHSSTPSTCHVSVAP